MGGLTLWRYRRRFDVGGKPALVTMRARTDRLLSELDEKLLSDMLDEVGRHTESAAGVLRKQDRP